jgi:hypothetical protein
MLLMLAVLVAAAAPTVLGPMSPLPPSFKKGALSACAPATVEAAEECLVHALSKQDLATMRDRSSSEPYREALLCEMELEWRLSDVNSPIAKAMHRKLGIHHPGLAASMIMQDFQMRATGAGLPWDDVRRDAVNIQGDSTPTTCPVVTPTRTERGNAN